MDGVTILNTIEPSFPVWAIIGFIITICITVAGFVIVEQEEKDKDIFGAVVYGIIFGVLFGGVLSLAPGAVIKSCKEPQYEVIVEENISLEEFSSKYEIIDKRGQIYIVEEREK